MPFENTLHTDSLLIDSPLGPLLAEADAEGVRRLDFIDGAGVAPGHGASPGSGVGALHLLAAELDRYFAGDLRRFSVPLAPRGTAFQRRVWDALLTIPFGETRSYDDLARALDAPGGQRAVGAANGANPVAIVIPCHRVVRKGGALGGYAGGLHRKRALLDLEGADRDASLFAGAAASAGGASR